MKNKILIWIIGLIILTSFVNALSINDVISYYKSDVNGSYPDEKLINNGSIAGATFNVSGFINNTYTYDGSNDRITITDSASIRFTEANNFTFNCWVRGTYDGGITEIVEKRATNDRYQIMLDASNKLQTEIGDGSNVQRITDSIAINPSLWIMITLVYTGTNETSCFYKNNTLIGCDNTNLAGLSTTGANLYIGGGSNGYFKGNIDECGIWNKALDSTERADLYNSHLGNQYPFINFFQVTAKTYFSNASITTFNATINGTFYNTTTGTILTNITKANTLINISINAVDHETAHYNNYNISDNLDAILYIPDSLIIAIKDEETNALITDNVTITFTSNTTEFNNITDTGSFYIELDPNKYNLLFSSDNYSSRTYQVTIGNGTHQTLTAYLSTNTNQTTFTLTDKDTSEILTNVLVTMYRMIGGTWSAVESKYTDVTGKAVLNYVPEKNYKFYLSKENYTDYVFYLNPVLYDEYSIQMEKQTDINDTQDYSQVALKYYPSSFNFEELTTFTFLIQSPYGELESYGFNISYPSGYNTSSGSNAIGGQLTTSFNITTATWTDRVRLDYYYKVTTKPMKNFTIYLPINFPNVGNNTFMNNQNNTYGLGTFERVLIAVIIVLFVVGVASLIGQVISGSILGLFVYSYLVYIGFIPLWSILISAFIGIMFISWKSGG